MTTLSDLDPTDSATWLEARGHFERWALGPEESVWACADCGGIGDPDEGPCPECGLTVDEWDASDA